MIESLSISSCNFFGSLTTWKIPLEYRLNKSFPKAFPAFLPSSFSLRCLYWACALLMILSLALSTLSCVHCFCHLANTLLLYLLHPLKILISYAAQHPLLLYQQYLQRTQPSFNIYLTSYIICITDWNCHHMTNNVTYKGNFSAIKTTSVILCFNIQLSRYCITRGGMTVKSHL